MSSPDAVRVPVAAISNGLAYCQFCGLAIPGNATFLTTEGRTARICKTCLRIGNGAVARLERLCGCAGPERPKPGPEAA